MPTIDERIVQMKFDNKQFESGVSQSMSTLEKLKQSLKFENIGDSLRNIEFATSNLSAGLDSLREDVQSVANVFTPLGKIGQEVMEQIASSAVNAGKKMMHTFLGLDDINLGSSKYETQIKAVQTITNATGKSIETVEEQLKQLQHYTDETSYDFAEMVSTIGKFTASGIDLERALPAVEGIANWAAKAGAGKQQANSAMYNLAQSLASGSVKMKDWMSIENANMATKEVKDELIKTAIELGTLQKKSDSVGKIMKQTKKATKNAAAEFKEVEVDYRTFGETLTQGWLTADVLIKTLEKYADTGNPLGESAYEAAQKALTFSDAIGTVVDAVSSGWMDTMKYLFGNLEEAKVLWTDVSNALVDYADIFASYRNEVLETWHTQGGYTSAIEAATNIFGAFMNVILGVKDAFAEIIPPLTGEKLKEITDRIRDASIKIKKLFGNYKDREEYQKESEDETDSDKAEKKSEKVTKETYSALEHIKHIVRGYASMIDIIGRAAGAVFTVIKGIIKMVNPLITVAFRFVSIFSGMLQTLDSDIKKNNTFQKFASNILKFLSPVGKLINRITNSLNKFIDGYAAYLKTINKPNSFKNFLDYLLQYLKKKPFGKIIDTASKILKLVKKIRKAAVKAFSNIISKIKEFYNQWKFINSFDTLLFVIEYFITKIPIIGKIFTGLTGAFDGKKLVDIKNRIVNFVKGIISAFEQGKIKSIKDFANVILEQFKELIRGSIIETIATKVWNAINKIIDIITKFKNALVTFGAFVYEKIRGFIKEWNWISDLDQLLFVIEYFLSKIPLIGILFRDANGAFNGDILLGIKEGITNFVNDLTEAFKSGKINSMSDFFDFVYNSFKKAISGTALYDLVVQLEGLIHNIESLATSLINAFNTIYSFITGGKKITGRTVFDSILNAATQFIGAINWILDAINTSGIINTLSNSINTIIRTFSLFGNMLFNTISKIFGKNSESSFDGSLKSILKIINDFISDFNDSINKFIDGYSNFLKATGKKNVFGSFFEYVYITLRNSESPIGYAIRNIEYAIEKIIEVFTKVSSRITPVIKDLSGRIITFVSDIYSAFAVGKVSSISDFFSVFYDSFKKAINGTWLEDVFNRIENVIERINKYLNRVLAYATPVLNDVKDRFIKFINDMTSAFASGKITNVSDFFSVFYESFKEAVSGTNIENALNTIENVINRVVKAFEFIQNKVGPIIDWISEKVNYAFNFLRNTFNPIIGGIQNGISIISGILDEHTSIDGYLYELELLLSKIPIIGNLFKNTEGEFDGTFLLGIAVALRKFASDFKYFFKKNEINSVQDLFTALWNTFKGMSKDHKPFQILFSIVDGLSKAFSVLMTIGDAIIKTIDNIIISASKVVGTIGNTFNDLFGWAFNTNSSSKFIQWLAYIGQEIPLVDKIASLILNVSQFFGDFGEAFAEGLNSNGIVGAIDVIVNYFILLVERITTGLNNLVESYEAFLKDTGRENSLGSMIAFFLDSTFGDLSEDFEKFIAPLNSVKEKITTGIEGIKASISGFMDYIVGDATAPENVEFDDGIRGFFQRLTSRFSSLSDMLNVTMQEANAETLFNGNSNPIELIEKAYEEFIATNPFLEFLVSIGKLAFEVFNTVKLVVDSIGNIVSYIFDNASLPEDGNILENVIIIVTDFIKSLTNIVKSFNESGLISTIGSTVTTLYRIITTFAEMLYNGIARLFGFAADDSASTEMDGSLSSINAFLSNIIDTINHFFDMYEEFLGENEKTNSFASFFEFIAESLKTSEAPIAKFISNIIENFENIKSTISSIVTWVTDGITNFINWLFGIGDFVGQGLTDGTENSENSVDKAGKSLGQILFDAITKFLGIESPSKLFKWVGIMCALGLVGGLISGLGQSINKEELAAKFEKIKEAIQTVLRAISPILNAFINAVRTFIQKVGESFQGREINSISDFFSALWDGIKNGIPIIGKISNVAGPILSGLFNAVIDFVGKVSEAFKGKEINNFTDFFAALGEGIQNAIPFGDILKGLGNIVSNTVGPMVEKITGFIGMLTGSSTDISGVLENVKASMGDVTDELLKEGEDSDGKGDAQKKVLDFLGKAAKMLWPLVAVFAIYNAARALKKFAQGWNAWNYGTVGGQIYKVIESITMLLGMVAILSILPSDAVNSALVKLGIVVGLIIALFAAIAFIGKKSEALGDFGWSFFGFALGVIALAVGIGLMINAIKNAAKPENIVPALVALALIGGLFVVFFKMQGTMTSIGAEGKKGKMMLALSGILEMCAGIVLLVLSFNILSNALSNNSFGTSIGAFLILIGFITAIGLVMKSLMTITAMSPGGELTSKVRGFIPLTIAILGMVFAFGAVAHAISKYGGGTALLAAGLVVGLLAAISFLAISLQSTPTDLRKSIGNSIIIIAMAASLNLVVTALARLIEAVKGLSFGAGVVAIGGLAAIIVAIAYFATMIQTMHTNWKKSVAGVITLAASAAAIIFVVYAVKEMIDVIKQTNLGNAIVAFAGIAVILGEMLLFTKAIQYAPANWQKSISGLIALVGVAGALIGVIVALKGLFEATSGTPLGNMITVFAGISAILFIMCETVIRLQRQTGSIMRSISGIVGLVGVAGSLALVIESMTPLLQVVQGMSFESIVTVFGGIAIILLTMCATVIRLQTVSTTINKSISGAIGIISVAASLIGIIWSVKYLLETVKDINFGNAITVFGALTVMLITMCATVVSLQKIPTNIGKAITGAIGILSVAASLAIIIWSIKYLLETVDGMNFENVITVFGIIAGMLLVMSLTVTAFQKTSKTGVDSILNATGLVISMVGMALAISIMAEALSKALKNIKDVPVKSLQAFLAAIVTMVITLAAVALLLRETSFTALIAAGAGIAAALALLGLGIAIFATFAGAGIEAAGSALWVLGSDLGMFADMISDIDWNNVGNVTKFMTEDLLSIWAVISGIDFDEFYAKAAQLARVGAQLKQYTIAISGFGDSSSNSIIDLFNNLKEAMFIAGSIIIPEFISNSGLTQLGATLLNYTNEISGISLENQNGSNAIQLVTDAKTISEILSNISLADGIDTTLVALGSAIGLYYDTLNNISTDEDGNVQVPTVDSQMISQAFEALANAIPLGDIAMITSYASGGDNDMIKMSEGIYALGTALKKYGEDIGSLDADNVKNANDVLDKLAEVNRSLNPRDIFTVLLGDSDKDDKTFASFADDITSLGRALKTYGEDIGGIKKRSVANANSILDELMKVNTNLAITNIKSPLKTIMSIFTTDKSALTDFSGDIILLGQSLADYGESIGTLNDTQIQKANGVLDVILKTSKDIPTSGGLISKLFGGEKNLGGFANNVGNLGDGISQYASKISGVNLDNASASIDIIEKLVGMLGGLEKSGGLAGLFEGSKSFGDLGKGLGDLATDINSFYTNAKDVKSSDVEGAMEIVEKVIGWAQLLSDPYVIDPGTGYSTNIFDFMSDKISAVVDTIANLSSIKNSEGTNVIEALLNIGKQITEYVGNGIKDDEKIEEAKDAIGIVIAELQNEIRSFYDDFYDLGKYIIDGFIAGLNDPEKLEALKLAGDKSVGSVTAGTSNTKSASGNSPSLKGNFNTLTDEGKKSYTGAKMEAQSDKGKKLTKDNTKAIENNTKATEDNAPKFSKSDFKRLEGVGNKTADKLEKLYEGYQNALSGKISKHKFGNGDWEEITEADLKRYVKESDKLDILLHSGIDFSRLNGVKGKTANEWAERYVNYTKALNDEIKRHKYGYGEYVDITSEDLNRYLKDIEWMRKESNVNTKAIEDNTEATKNSTEFKMEPWMAGYQENRKSNGDTKGRTEEHIPEEHIPEELRFIEHKIDALEYKRNDSGLNTDEIKELQRLLNASGKTSKRIEENGVYDKETVQARVEYYHKLWDEGKEQREKAEELLKDISKQFSQYFSENSLSTQEERKANINLANESVKNYSIDYSQLPPEILESLGISADAASTSVDSATNSLNELSQTAGTEAVENLESLKQKMIEDYAQGNVDLLNRPMVSPDTMHNAGWKDFDGDYATLYSSTYTAGKGKEYDFGYDKNVVIDITPITKDGEVLSPESLDKYVVDLLKSDKPLLEADSIENGGRGLLLKVTPVTEDLSKTIAQQEEWTSNLSKMQSTYDEASGRLDEFNKKVKETEQTTDEIDLSSIMNIDDKKIDEFSSKIGASASEVKDTIVGTLKDAFTTGDFSNITEKLVSAIKEKFNGKLEGVSVDGFVNSIMGEDLGEKMQSMMSENGGLAIDGFVSGVDGKSGEATKAMTDTMSDMNLGVESLMLMHSPSKLYEYYGQMMIEGLILGLSNGASRVANMARYVARQAYEAAKHELGINSPSERFSWVGQMVCEGFALGLDNYSELVGTASSSMADTAIDNAINGVSRLYDSIGSETVPTPAVRPVIDDSQPAAMAQSSGFTQTDSETLIRLATSSDMVSTIAAAIQTDVAAIKESVDKGNADIIAEFKSLNEHIDALDRDIMNTKIYLDSNAIVAGTVSKMDRALGQRYFNSGGRR